MVAVRETFPRRSARYRASVNNDSEPALCVQGPSSQRTQIIRHIAELSQHSRVREIAGGRITSAAERDRAGMAHRFTEIVRTLYRGGWIRASMGSPTMMLLSATSNGNATK
jgi:hypothetical protein